MKLVEIQKQSLNICDVSQNISIESQDDLFKAVDFLKQIKHHKEQVIKYWEEPKKSAWQAHKAITQKEKGMLFLCEQIERNLKNQILEYKTKNQERYSELVKEAEEAKKLEIEDLQKEADELWKSGDKQGSTAKLAEAGKLANMITISNFEQKLEDVITQKRWKCRIVDKSVVPAFFNGTEIREINTKKLLEIHKLQPNVEIQGVEFYQEETVVIKN
ncbi:hypothetical protein FACS189465_3470 [Clostridia bacterium]|nr:hypothetical protein FACS189465_3470 [Clostridia bacterium]